MRGVEARAGPHELRRRTRGPLRSGTAKIPPPSVAPVTMLAGSTDVLRPARLAFLDAAALSQLLSAVAMPELGGVASSIQQRVTTIFACAMQDSVTTLYEDSGYEDHWRPRLSPENRKRGTPRTAQRMPLMPGAPLSLWRGHICTAHWPLRTNRLLFRCSSQAAIATALAQELEKEERKRGSLRKQAAESAKAAELSRFATPGGSRPNSLRVSSGRPPVSRSPSVWQARRASMNLANFARRVVGGRRQMALHVGASSTPAQSRPSEQRVNATHRAVGRE